MGRGEVQRQEYIQLLGRIQKWRPVPSKRDGCLMPNLIETTFVEPKMKRKFAKEYSTAEKWASKS